MKREDLHLPEARDFTWNHLWHAEAQSFLSCQILDAVHVAQTGELKKWLFTTRDGEVKSKSSKNRTIHNLLKALRCPVDRCEARFHGFYCTEAGQDWYQINGHEHLQSLLEAHASPMIIVPHPHVDGNGVKFLEIVCERDEKKAILEPKMKFYWLSHGSAAGKVKERHQRKDGSEFWPKERLQCRNNALNDEARRFALGMLSHLENRGNFRILRATFVVHINETISLAPSAEGSTNSSFRIALHHARHLEFEGAQHQTRQKSDMVSTGEFSTKLSSHGFLARQASLSSVVSSTYIKPWTFCDGVFCNYSVSDADSKPGFSLDVDFEEGDIIAESQRAIARHRAEGAESSSSVPNSAESSSRRRSNSDLTELAGDDGTLSNVGSFHPSKIPPNLIDTATQQSQALPVKTNRILYKNLILVRDEIRRLELVDREHQNDDAGHDTSEKLDSIYSMREAMKEIWPLPLIRWWFAQGQFYVSHVRGGVGRLPASINPETYLADSLANTVAQTLQQQQNKHSNISGDKSAADDNLSSTSQSKPLSTVSLNPYSSAHPSIPFSDKANAQLNDVSDYPDRRTLLNNPEDVKWFSLHHSHVTVCTNCYLVYCKLEKFRRQKHERMRESKLQDQRKQQRASGVAGGLSDAEYQALSPEAQREHDRELERRIFAQRKAVYKLSQAKVRTDDGQLPPRPQLKGVHRRGGGGPPRNALPPLPWRLSEAHERERYLAPAANSTAEKLLQKQPMRSHSASLLESGGMGSISSIGSFGGLSGSVVDSSSYSQSLAKNEEWDAMVQQAQQKSRLQPLTHKPVTNITPQHSLKVAVDQYTAEHLLHPWQRDLKRLKDALTDVSSGGSQVQQPSAQPGLTKPSQGVSGGNPSKPTQLTKAVSFRLDTADPEEFQSSGFASRGASASTGALPAMSPYQRPSTSASSSLLSGGSSRRDSESSTSQQAFARQMSWGSVPGSAALSLLGGGPDGSLAEHEEDDEDDEDDALPGQAALGWNPFVIQT